MRVGRLKNAMFSQWVSQRSSSAEKGNLNSKIEILENQIKTEFGTFVGMDEKPDIIFKNGCKCAFRDWEFASIGKNFFEKNCR